MEDQLFESIERVEDFAFDENVANVFDDMVSRSVPFYAEMQRMVVELAATFLGTGGTAYDIGCSTGSTIHDMAAAVPQSAGARFVGVEPSAPMLAKAEDKLRGVEGRERIELVNCDAQALAELPDAQVVTMLYTLQFIRPLDRLGVLQMFHGSLRPGGCLLLAEKVLADEAFARRLYIDLYHRYKQRLGYTLTEITKKREALENVLVPFRNSENLSLLRQAGFGEVEQAFRWYNFALYVAVKA